MKILVLSGLNDVDELVSLDKEVIGNESRRDYIHRAVVENRCILVKTERQIAGFLIYDTHFFECSFIWLLIVKPSERRQGHATSLLQHFIQMSPTKKVFSSTNQSNITMQAVFKANGFVPSGYIENLDEGDPELVYFRFK